MKNIFEKQKLVPVIIQDYQTKEVRMLGYMNQISFNKTVETGNVWFWSRSRKRLWMKGESSENKLIVKEIYIDCDMDTILILAEQVGEVTCHTGTRTCFRKLYFQKLENENN